MKFSLQEIRFIRLSVVAYKIRHRLTKPSSFRAVKEWHGCISAPSIEPRDLHIAQSSSKRCTIPKYIYCLFNSNWSPKGNWHKKTINAHAWNWWAITPGTYIEMLVTVYLHCNTGHCNSKGSSREGCKFRCAQLCLLGKRMPEGSFPWSI